MDLPTYHPTSASTQPLNQVTWVLSLWIQIRFFAVYKSVARIVPRQYPTLGSDLQICLIVDCVNMNKAFNKSRTDNFLR